MKTSDSISDPLSNGAIGTRRAAWLRAKELNWPTVTLSLTGRTVGGHEEAWTELMRDGDVTDVFDAYLMMDDIRAPEHQP